MKTVIIFINTINNKNHLSVPKGQAPTHIYLSVVMHINIENVYLNTLNKKKIIIKDIEIVKIFSTNLNCVHHCCYLL